MSKDILGLVNKKKLWRLDRAYALGLGKPRVDFTRLKVDLTSSVLLNFPKDHLLSLKWG